MPILVFVLTLTACGDGQFNAPKDTTIETDSKYIYLSTPWVDFTKAERVQALIEAKRMIIETLQREIPDNIVTRRAVAALGDSNKQEVEEILETADKWINDHQDRLNRFGFRLQDFIPSAAIISFGGGGKLDIGNDKLARETASEATEAAADAAKKKAKVGRAGAAIGGLGLLKNGGSFTIGVIIVPMKVVKIHKLTKEVSESWYRFKMSIVGIPDVNLVVRGQKRGKAGLRMGLGFVFGELQDPKDFRGLSIGYSLNYKYGAQELTSKIEDGRSTLGFLDKNGKWQERKGHGLNIKVAALKREVRGIFQNIYVIASSRLGLQQGSDHEYNIGPVLKLNKIVELITGQDFSDLESDKLPVSDQAE